VVETTVVSGVVVSTVVLVVDSAVLEVVLASDVLLATVELVVSFDDGDRLGLDVGPEVGE